MQFESISCPVNRQEAVGVTKNITSQRVLAQMSWPPPPPLGEQQSQEHRQTPPHASSPNKKLDDEKEEVSCLL